MPTAVSVTRPVTRLPDVGKTNVPTVKPAKEGLSVDPTA